MDQKRKIERLVVLATALVSGCHDQAARIAENAAQRQAEQNQSIAKLHEHVAAGTQRLAEEEAQSRQQALAIHQHLQHERSQLNGGWNDLESERKAIAGSRRTDSSLSALVKGGGGVLAALLALAFAWLALFGLRFEGDESAACELLVDELGESPWLGPRVVALNEAAAASLERLPFEATSSQQLPMSEVQP
jgi:hypothetical protein